jgi:hypothetical protein
MRLVNELSGFEEPLRIGGPELQWSKNLVAIDKRASTPFQFDIGLPAGLLKRIAMEISQILNDIPRFPTLPT